MAQATNQPKFQIFAESNVKFFYKVVDAQIVFKPSEDKKVNEFVLYQNGGEYKFNRITSK